MSNNQKKFNWRGWTTFLVIISFIVDTISGIVLYISPPGRIAHWTNWTFWGLGKDAWGAIHTIFGYLLLIIVAIHLYYNWKMFWHFVWSSVRKALNLKQELAAAVLINLLVFLLTIWNIPPFSSIMNLGEHFKESWEESKADQPFSHAESVNLMELSLKIQIPIDQVSSALKSKGYLVRNARQTLEEIAKENKTSPDKLYESIKSAGLKPTVPLGGKGSGLGRKTLEAVCAEKEIYHKSL